jgi:hypothetical protein
LRPQEDGTAQRNGFANNIVGENADDTVHV